jgi:hypothetical protein
MPDEPVVDRTVFFASPMPGPPGGDRPAIGWLVRKAAVDAGFTVLSTSHETAADQDWSPSLFGSIRAADVVVVDLSVPSSNVMLELGVARGLSKPVLLLGTSESQLPVDLAARQVVRLDVGAAELRTSLVDALNRLVTTPDAITASLLDIETTTHFATGRHPETQQHIVVNIYNGPVFQAPITVTDSATFSAHDSIATTTLVQRGDRQELVGALRALGLPDEQLKEMSDALDMDADDGADPSEPGPRFQRWWTRATIGAAKVTGNVGVGASGDLVARLIAGYFGLH